MASTPWNMKDYTIGVDMGSAASIGASDLPIVTMQPISINGSSSPSDIVLRMGDHLIKLADAQPLEISHIPIDGPMAVNVEFKVGSISFIEEEIKQKIVSNNEFDRIDMCM